MEIVIFFFQNKGGDTTELYLIRIVCVRTVNMPTESQSRNMTLSQNNGTNT